jgi:hypothetical protein
MEDLKIHYEKRKNGDLFKSMQKKDGLNLTDTQNYIPIYNKFFLLNETNYNTVNLNNTFYVHNLLHKDEDVKNMYKCHIRNIKDESTDKKIVKPVFFKMAPLLDPFKYLIGKYNINDPHLFDLPKYNSTHGDVHPKLLDVNNSAYVDGHFVFLSSILLHKYKFSHSLDYYGSFLSIKNDFKIDIIDDIEYLDKSEFFNENKNKLFHVEDFSFLLDPSENETKKPLIVIDKNVSNKSKLSIQSINEDLYENLFISELDLEKEENSAVKTNENVITLQDIKELSLEIPDFNMMLVDGTNKTTTIKSNSTCSSRTSHTSNSEDSTVDLESSTAVKININSEDIDINAEDILDTDTKTKTNTVGDCEQCDLVEEFVDDDEWEDEDSNSSFSEEEQQVELTIPKFPVNVICMECCEDTLDNLIDSNPDLPDEEFFSALMQIIMILLTFQKVFAFTHNDLHTNNVMYNATKKKYLYYCYKKKYYKVPTYGRIFKIIDFGRSIYKVNQKVFCSDSFQPGADAATQYNTEPYFNEKKPRLEPNYSFDLCRLACSIFDFVIEDMEEVLPKNLSKCSPVARLINEWCSDDNGINILYKNNGAERYPDFKLYKMIARLVHNHTPQAQLERKEFSKFVINKNNVDKNELIMNIDEIPCL